MLEYIKKALITEPISGVTINWVITSPAFRTLIYVLLIIVFLSVSMWFIIKKYNPKISIKKSLIITFFITGLFYSFYGELYWWRWVINDWHLFHGKSTEEKLHTLEESIYILSRLSKDVIPDETYDINLTSHYISLRIQYFLLPLKRKENAPYIIVLVDKNTSFNPEKGILITDNKRFENMEMFYLISPDVYILRKR